MNKVKNILLFFVIIFFSALAGMSVYGAFIGPYQTKFFFNSPVTFITRITNLGNVHLKPQGEISIKNLFGNKVGELKVNEAKG